VGESDAPPPRADLFLVTIEVQEGFADCGRPKPAEAGVPERRLQPALGKERGQVLNSYCF
jgi:hypothetical protein